MTTAAMYLSGVLLLTAGALKMPAVARTRGRDRLLLLTWALLITAGGVLCTTAQPTIRWLNDQTGVANFGAPVVYTLLTMFSGLSIMLVLHWRGGPEERVRRLTRTTATTYGIVCALIILLFAAGKAPVEKTTDFDLHYAGTPYIREMLVLYLAAHALASAVVSQMCWQWSAQVHDALRPGLRILSAGYLTHLLGYDLMMALAVAGRWAGHSWDTLVDVARAVIVPSAMLGWTGVLFPLIVRSGKEAARYFKLAPLARAVSTVPTAASPAPLSMSPWRPAIRLRLTARQTFIYDRLVACRRYFEPHIREEARATALARQASESEAAAWADAAMIMAAVARCRQAQVPETVEHALFETPTITNDLVDIAKALRAGTACRNRH
ncbi:DUF6545 domain-containing protein [Streptomyces sp. NPDC002640]